MKKCPTCGNIYSDDIQHCLDCDIELEAYDKKNDNDSAYIEITLKTALIALVAIIFISVIANIGGRFIKLNDTYIDETFETSKTNFISYTQAQSNFEEHQSKKQELTSSKKTKQETLNKLNDFETHQSEYNLEIQNLASQSNSLDAQVSEKQNVLDSINAQIATEKNKPIILPAGHYTVGTHIDAGRYVVTGSSNFIVYSSSGSLLVNTILGGGRWGVEDYTCNLSNGDLIEASGKDTYTKIN